MAKQLVNPLERHIEKAILSVTGLALVGSIALYLVRTPNLTELGGEQVAPSSIDAKIAAKATEAVGRLRSANRPATIPEPLFETFNGLLAPIKTSLLPAAVAMGPEVPFVDTDIGPGGPAGLVKIKTPDKPTIAHGRGTFVSTDASDQTLYVPSDWVTVSAVLNVKEQREAQIREYGSTQPELVFAPAQIQRRIQRPNGSWSDGDWKDIDGFPSAKLPKEPVILLLSEGKKIEVDKDVLKAIDQFKGELSQASLQLEVLRPMPPEMAKPTRWVLPKITSYRDVLLQDDEFLFPHEAPSPDPVDRYGVNDESVVKDAAKQLTAAEMNAKRLTEGEALLDAAKKNKSKADAVRAFNNAFDVINDRAASPGDKARAEKLKTTAEQAVKDIERELRIGQGNKLPGQPDQPDAAAKPKREKRLTQQIWVHDAAVGSLQNGATYQYRMRFRLLNLLAGAPHKFDKPENAGVLFITGEWSEPSDPVVIAPAVEFFVTGEDSKDKEISVDIYRWYLGVWVKPKNRIKTGIGGAIADRQRTTAPALDNTSVADTPEVDFQAGASVVDIDLDRPIRDRRAGTAATGVKFGPPVPSTAAVLVDAQGKLWERWVPVDKGHPQKREAEVKVWKPTQK